MSSIVIKRLGLILILLFVVILGGCAEYSKTPISKDDFTKIMSELDYSVIDISNQYATDDSVKNVILAISKDDNFQIEFYEFDSNATAGDIYRKNETDLNNAYFDAVIKSVETRVGSNYKRKSIIGSGEFCIISQIGNTFIFVHTDEIYKQNITDAINKLGY